MSENAYAASRIVYVRKWEKEKWLPSALNVNQFGIVTEEEDAFALSKKLYLFWLDFYRKQRVEVKMTHSPLEKIHALDAIEKDIINCVQSAGRWQN